MTSTSALLLLADQFRDRTRQRALGMSELGTCRRKVGYKLAGVKPVNRVGSVQAVIGSAIHDAVADVLKRLDRPGDLVEHEVEYAGLIGHLDRYESEEQRVVDVKTVSTRWLEHIKLHGPSRGHIWQVSLYAAALAVKGTPVKWCRLDYLVRDSGVEYQVEWAFDSKHVKEALDWLREVRGTPLPMLPRDEEPDSPMCQGCPFGGRDGGICWKGYVQDRDFRSVFLAEGVSAGEAADALFDVRQQLKDLKKREDRLKGILDGERPPNQWDVVRAGDRYLKWTPTRGGSFSLRFVPKPDTEEEA